MNVRSVLIVMIVAPLASIALGQGYQGPGPQAQRPAPAAAPAAPTPPETPTPSTQSIASTTPAANMPSVPAHGCVQPVYPGKAAADAKIKAFNSSYKDYGDCIRKYVDGARTLSRQATDSGNEAVTEFNNYTEDIKKKLDAEK